MIRFIFSLFAFIASALLIKVSTFSLNAETLPKQTPMQENIHDSDPVPLDTIDSNGSTVDLQEFVVLGNKDKVRIDGNKIIFTPGDLKTKVTTALELMKLTPTLSEEKDVFYVLNKAALILINGKDPHMPHNQIIAKLRSMPPSNIKSIEVIPNAGSEYSASDNRSLINVNIVDEGNGILTSVSVTGYITENSYENSDDVIFNFTHDRLKIKAYGYFRSGTLSLKQSNAYSFNLKNNLENLYIENLQNSKYLNSLGVCNLFMSYDLSKNSIIGGGLALYSTKEKDTYSTTSTYRGKGSEEETTSSISIFDQPWSSPQIYYKLFYNLTTDAKGSNLEVSGLYRTEKIHSTTSYDFDNDRDEFRENSDKGGSADVKYTYIFNSNQSLKGGYSFNTTKHYDLSKSVIQDYCFDYDETINAAFLQLDSRWGKCFSSNLGVRLENDRITGGVSNTDNFYHRNETGFYPSLSVSYASTNGRHFIMLNLNNYIFRPQFIDLNPYILWTSENTCVVGNPNLRSAKFWDISCIYLFLQNYIFNVSYTHGKDYATRFSYGENGVSFTTHINAPVSHRWFISFEFNKDLLTCWRLKARPYWSYDFTPFIFNGVSLTEKSHKVGLDLKNHFSLPGKWSPNIDFDSQIGYWQQGFTWGNMPFFNTTLAFSKTILSDLNINLSVSWSPSSKWVQKTTWPDYIQELKNLNIPVTCYLTLSYKFGNNKINRYQNGGDDSYNSRF